MWGALSDERTGLSFTIAAGPRQRSHSRVRVPRDSCPCFSVSDCTPRNRMAQLYPQALGSLFVVSCGSQGYGGGIRTRLHAGIIQLKMKVTLRLAVYRQAIYLVAKPFETHDQSSLYRPGTDRTENVSSIIACSLVAIETICPQSCSLATAVLLSHVYTTVTWQWVYMSRYYYRLILFK
jgi:hypothetical protein